MWQEGIISGQIFGKLMRTREDTEATGSLR